MALSNTTAKPFPRILPLSSGPRSLAQILMSENKRLVLLEAQTQENTRTLEALAQRNAVLRAENQTQIRDIHHIGSALREAREFENYAIGTGAVQEYKSEVEDRNEEAGVSFEEIDLRTTPSPHEHLGPQTPSHASVEWRLPEEPPTDWNNAAADAVRLCLAFAISGENGELFEIPIETTDLGFVLQQSLRRNNWRDERIILAVEVGYSDSLGAYTG